MNDDSHSSPLSESSGSGGSDGTSPPNQYRVTGLKDHAHSFIHTEEVGALILLAAAAFAVILANSPFSESYGAFWHTHILIETPLFHISEDLQHLVNDALMAIFFFVVGLEIKREILHGELSTFRRASLPVFAAIGGMAAPAFIYFLINPSGESAVGWGIPMATDIAFALGVLALLGRRAPTELRVFLLGLAVVDDLGAISVIAIFYTDTIHWESLGIALAILVTIGVLVRVGIRSLVVFIIMGFLVWYFFLESGIHATAAGVLLAILVPSRVNIDRRDEATLLDNLVHDLQMAIDTGDDQRAEMIVEEIEKVTQRAESPLERLETKTHPWVSLVILPIFALANAGITVTGDTLSAATDSTITVGVVLGLLLGNPIGIFGITWIAVRLGIGQLPSGVTWSHILGVSFLAGIGFTVAIFISTIAFDDSGLVTQAKMGIFGASILAAVIGYCLLRFTSGKNEEIAESAA